MTADIVGRQAFASRLQTQQVGLRHAGSGSRIWFAEPHIVKVAVARPCLIQHMKTRPATFAWQILTVVSAMLWQTSDAAGCLQYDFMSLTGTLVRQTYAGPPDYESVTKGDEPRIIWVLLLDQSICVADPDPRFPREYYEREIQLVVKPHQFTSYRNLLGKKVIATGKLLHGGATYEKRLVLMVEEMSRKHP